MRLLILFAKTLGILLALVIAVALGAFFWIQDANRLKPEITALLNNNTDYQVELNGDLAWQLFPPLKLNIADLTAVRETPEHRDYQKIEASSIALDLDVSAIWQDVNQWKITDFKVSDTTIHTKTSTTKITQFDLADFRPGEPATFELTATSLTDPEAPLDAHAAGSLTYWPATATTPQRINFDQTRIDADLVTGVCDGEATENPNAPTVLPEPSKADLLPIDTLLEYNVAARCQLDSLTLGTETFHSSDVDIANTNGSMNVALQVRDFLGGTLNTQINADANAQPVSWQITPNIENVDSQRLLDWTQQRLQWVALIALNGTLTMQGNTTDELAASVKAVTDFDGGQGQLNIAKIKEQLLRIATLTNKKEDVERWPDVWDYQTFVGNWQINGQQHALDFELDNMAVVAEGTYDHVGDQLDLLGHVTISEALENTPFKINPLLEGTPIPVRCRGALEDPTCRVDEKASQNIVAKALQRGSDSGLRRKLEDKIDEKVPEEYREAARNLLDLLGRKLEDEED